MSEQTVAVGPDFADQLITELDEATCWPLPREVIPHRVATEGRAMRKGDREWLKDMHGWDRERAYHVDNLARRIAFGWADFLFADDLTVTAASDEDARTEREAQDTNDNDAAADMAQAELDHTLEATNFQALLHRAERIIVSEGEGYWKLHVNRAVCDTAIVNWTSRRDTVPLLYGETLLAAAFITTRKEEKALYRPEDADATDVIWRHAEVHTTGRVVNVLYRGTRDQLGTRMQLTDLAQTAGYAEEWPHGLAMLAGRVVNDLDDDPAQGVGEFDTIRDQLLDLNEAVTIAAENARLTGQDRIFAPGRFMQSDGSFDASLQVFQLEDESGTLGGEGDKTSIVAIEKKYDAAPLWLHITNLVKTALNRVGLVPQWVGEEVQGHAESGLAIRLRFIPTTNAAKGKHREWGRAVPLILHRMLEVAALPVDQGGFARTGAQGEPPAVEFGDPIPADQSRDLLDMAAAVASEVMSRQTAIETLHPEWTEQQVADEIARIEKERSAGVIAAIPQPAPIQPVEPPHSASGGGGGSSK